MWNDIKGPVIADTVYESGQLVAKDVAFTLPSLEFLTTDVQAMGNMTVPLVGLLENMELSITKIGIDKGLGQLNYTVTRQQIYCNGEEYLCVDRLSGVLRVAGTDYYTDISSLL